MSGLLIAVLALSVPPADGEVVAPTARPDTAATAESPGAKSLPVKAADYKVPPPRTGVELRDAVKAALPRWARVKDDKADAAAREFLVLYGELAADKKLARTGRDYLMAKVRIRLDQLSSQISKRIAKEKKAAAAEPAKPGSVKLPEGKVDLFAQRQGIGNVAAGMRDVGFGQQGMGPADNGQQLVDLIQQVIAPTSWEVNGGPGTIYYWRPVHAMVVRQTDEVHENIANLLEQLRRAN